MDIWAIGCIMAELIIKQPLFKSDNYIQLIKLIINILNVSDADLLKYEFGYKIMKKEKEETKKTFSQYFRKKEEKNSTNIYEPISDILFELIESMLTFNHLLRPNSECILNNEYFDEYRYKLEEYKNPPVQFKLDIEQENALIENDNIIGIKKLIYNQVLDL